MTTEAEAEGLRSQSPDIELGPYMQNSAQEAEALAPRPTWQGFFESEIDPQLPSGAARLRSPSRLPTYSSYDPGAQRPHGNPHSSPPPPPPPTVANEGPPDPAQTNLTDGNHGDSSDRLFTIYLAQAERYDKEQSESWKGDTEGILVFTGLFSATVAAFIVESYQQLQPSSSDATVILLAQISQQLVAISHGIPTTAPSILPSQSFRPSASSVRVNTLWFLSLALSLTCALLATLMQQWVRRYLQVSQRRYTPYKRARIRTFFAEGVDHFGLPRAVEALPALLHISVFLFFAGLVDFLLNINHTVAYFLLSAVVAGASAYFLCTAMPLVHPSSPYQTPLTTLFWTAHQAVLLMTLDFTRRAVKFVYEHTGLVAWRFYSRVLFLLDDHSWRFAQGLSRSRETVALRQPVEMDARALEWTLDVLDEDHELEQLVLALPGYHASRTARSPAAALEHLTHHEGLDAPLEARILDLLCPRGTIPDAPPTTLRERSRRIACLEALYRIPGAVLRRLRGDPYLPEQFSTDPLFASSESWHVALALARSAEPDVALAAHCVLAAFVAAWNSGFARAPPALALSAHLDVPLAWAAHPETAALASLLRLVAHALDGVHARDVEDVLPIVAPPPAVIGAQHALLYTSFGLANKLSAAGAPRELQDALAALWIRAERMEQAVRESGYRARGLEMVLRRLQPVYSSLPLRVIESL
ncbi:hypothetical protein BC834DRAFT_1012336 [Gloeopeniophorella convolvens]|nr:hypothetical protein BC834DRAFT_1012336 [Gloeopeniophorella convolvens]